MAKKTKAVVLGVGAERGLGAAASRRFAKEGYHVLVAGRTGPKIDKVVLNMGIGEAVADSKKAGLAMADLAKIAGQKPAPTRARLSVAQFKVRENMVIGAKVTLRKARMYEFLDRLITIALPRVKDFRGLKPTSFDGRGNFAMGLKEHLVFPEINYDEIDQMWGMDIIVATTAKTDDEARALLKEFQFPFTQS